MFYDNLKVVFGLSNVFHYVYSFEVEVLIQFKLIFQNHVSFDFLVKSSIIKQKAILKSRAASTK